MHSNEAQPETESASDHCPHCHSTSGLYTHATVARCRDCDGVVEHEDDNV